MVRINYLSHLTVEQPMVLNLECLDKNAQRNLHDITQTLTHKQDHKVFFFKQKLF